MIYRAKQLQKVSDTNKNGSSAFILAHMALSTTINPLNYIRSIYRRRICLLDHEIMFLRDVVLGLHHVLSFIKSTRLCSPFLWTPYAVECCVTCMLLL